MWHRKVTASTLGFMNVSGSGAQKPVQLIIPTPGSSPAKCQARQVNGAIAWTRSLVTGVLNLNSVAHNPRSSCICSDGKFEGIYRSLHYQAVVCIWSHMLKSIVSGQKKS